MQNLPVAALHGDSAPCDPCASGCNAVYLFLRAQKTFFIPGWNGYSENAFGSDGGVSFNAAGTGLFYIGFL